MIFLWLMLHANLIIIGNLNTNLLQSPIESNGSWKIKVTMFYSSMQRERCKNATEALLLNFFKFSQTIRHKIDTATALLSLKSLYTRSKVATFHVLDPFQAEASWFVGAKVSPPSLPGSAAQPSSAGSKPHHVLFHLSWTYCLLVSAC